MGSSRTARHEEVLSSRRSHKRRLYSAMAGLCAANNYFLQSTDSYPHRGICQGPLENYILTLAQLVLRACVFVVFYTIRQKSSLCNARASFSHRWKHQAVSSFVNCGFLNICIAREWLERQCPRFPPLINLPLILYFTLGYLSKVIGTWRKK